MQEMAIRIDKLETENAKLKRTQSKKQKISIIEWLNNSTQLVQPDTDFDNWITTYVFSLIPQFLDTVYTRDLLAGINALFNFAVANMPSDKSPIRTFDNKPNTFYIYYKDRHDASCVDPKWVIIYSIDFDKYLDKISRQFIVEFVRCWYNVHKERVETDEKYKDTYIEYYQKILGGNKMTDEIRFPRIRHALYTAIKQNAKCIIDDDFV